MKKTRKIRFLAFILTLCLTLGALPLYVFADGMEAELPEQITETTNENLTAFQLGLGEKSVAELESMTLSAADIPASISRETIEAKDHVLRLREQEADLNTVIFQNRDGGKTVYLFGSPVKYVDANGNIRDKSTTLVSENVTVNGKTYAHSATDNFFGQYYPTMPQNGVMLAFGPYTVEMKPVITGVLTLRDTVVSDNKVTYNKVFGTGTSLVYTPTLNGVKEDIILSTYTGKSSFSFTIKTNGLAIIQDENDTFLADFEGNKVASLGDVIITDKVGKTVYGTMTVATKIEREEYTVTVNAPTAFLTNPTTVYPVTVDPTLRIDEEEYISVGDFDDYGSAIQDLFIYENTHPGYPTSSLGKLGYDEEACEIGVSRVLYRINPAYYDYGINCNYFSNSRFGSATLNIPMYASMGSYTVYAYRYTSDWGIFEGEDEHGNYYLEYQNGSTSNYTGDNRFDSYDSSIVSSATVTSSAVQTVSLDISSFVECWINDHSTFSQGIMLKLADDDSTEHEGAEYVNVYNTESSSYDVYISLDYGNIVGESYINNKKTGHFLMYFGAGTSATTSTYDILTKYKWKITYYGNNQYYIKSSVTDKLYLCSKDGSTAKTVNYSGTLTNEYLWTITYNASYDGYLIKNVEYNRYLKATSSDTTALTSTLNSYCVWRLRETRRYRNLTEFTIDNVVGRLDSNASYVIEKENMATWSANSDFVLSTSYQLTVNYSSSTILCNKKGTHSVTVTHKPSGKTATFELVVYRPAVFLIHGRGDNSITLWGATTKVWVDPNDTSEKANNNFGSSVTQTNDTISVSYEYTDIATQRISAFNYGEKTVPAIFNIEGENIFNIPDPKKGNLAYYLTDENGEVSNAYEANIDLYVFNYPNEDAVVHNANKLDAYLTNLATEIRSNGTKQQKLSLFGKIDGITAATPLNIHIVGHSMGGLVARYYIENIGKDENVEKLITIDTPHWGSKKANISNAVGIFELHKLCDHDLSTDSALFSISPFVGPDVFWGNCSLCPGVSMYVGSSPFLFASERRTKYYAIAGIDYMSDATSEEDISFDLPTNIINCDALKEKIKELSGHRLYKSSIANQYNYLEPDLYGDNVVEFLSQIGWRDSNGNTRIEFEKIFVNVDASGRNTLEDHYHGKMPHRKIVLQKVCDYLNE